MTATTAFFHFAKKIHNRRRIPENPRIVAVGDVRGHITKKETYKKLNQNIPRKCYIRF